MKIDQLLDHRFKRDALSQVLGQLVPKKIELNFICNCLEFNKIISKLFKLQSDFIFNHSFLKQFTFWSDDETSFFSERSFVLCFFVEKFVERLYSELTLLILQFDALDLLLRALRLVQFPHVFSKQ
jgi:hypothetical protein